MIDRVDKIMLEFKNGLLTLGDARNKIIKLILEKIKDTFKNIQNEN